MSNPAAIHAEKSKFTEKGDSITNQINICKHYSKDKAADAMPAALIYIILLYKLYEADDATSLQGASSRIPCIFLLFQDSHETF